MGRGSERYARGTTVQFIYLLIELVLVGEVVNRGG